MRNRSGELAVVHREAWKVWWIAFMAMVFVLFAAWALVRPAAAAYQVASAEEVAAAECQMTLYEGLTGTAEMSSCQQVLYLPTSAAFKCELYKDSGYPSGLMKKACMLLELGYLESLDGGSNDPVN